MPKIHFGSAGTAGTPNTTQLYGYNNMEKRLSGMMRGSFHSHVLRAQPPKWDTLFTASLLLIAEDFSFEM